MRSIRLSLTVYFLALVSLALGAVSVLVYRSATQTLREKEHAAEQLLQTRYEEECDRERQHLDQALFSQAQTLAREVQFRNARFEALRYWPLNSLGALTTAPTPVPLGSFSALPWVLQGQQKDNELNWFLMRRATFDPGAKIALNPADLPPPINDNAPDYFQINSAWGAIYRSPSLGKRTFGFDAGVFAPNRPVFDVRYDDEHVGDIKVRRVLVLAPAARNVPWGGFYGGPPQRSRNGGGKEGGGRGAPPRSPDDPGTQPQQPPPPRMDFWTRPALCIQYASEVNKLDATLADLKTKLDEDLEDVHERSRESLAQLRNHLLLIAGVCFAAVLLGTLSLVRLSLAPLKRVSEAVSQVTERDFRLQLDSRPLPGELTPIVERLSQTLEQLKRAFEREKQATADISHELRTPLSALLTTIEVTLRKPRKSDEYRDALEDCRASAGQINHAVERLMALARLDAGVDRVRSQTVDAADVAKQCIAVIRPLAEARGLHLSLHAEEDAVLETDPDKLREILSNLLHNAIQYNRPDGTIDVVVHREDGRLQLEVRDTGIGIAPSARPHLFERFYRADPSRQTDGLNAGLGLAIVKGYLDLMGGTIEVDSVEGQGSIFRVCMPA
jgi:signal transduction histidine kinase